MSGLQLSIVLIVFMALVGLILQMQWLLTILVAFALALIGFGIILGVFYRISYLLDITPPCEDEIDE